MSRGLVINTVLLVAALGFAYQTWTRDKTVKVVRGEFVLWEGKPADVQALDYEVQDKRTTRIEQRSDDHGDYLWAIVTRTTKVPPKRKPKPPKNLDAGVADAEPEPEPEIKTVTKEFPVGKVGDELFAGVAPLRALRELGKLDDEQRVEYDLDEAGTQLTVHFKSGAKTLILGGRVYGGSDRYVVERSTGDAYIIPGEIVRALGGGDSALRDGKIFPFEIKDVATATIKTASAEMKLVRGKMKSDPPDGLHGQRKKEEVSWAHADSPGEPDQTLANFMSRVNKLTPADYLPSMSRQGLTEVVRIEYAGKDGQALGHLELYKKPGTREGTFDYYVFSERTRVIAKTHPGAAKRVDKDLEQLFAPAE